MMQPCELTPLPSTPLAQQVQPWHLEPAAIAWGVLLVGVLLFEMWALATGHQTLSQWVQHLNRWQRLLAFGGFAVLLWHLFVGF